MNVVFSHGKESGPWGRKIRFLSEIATQRQCTVQSIDYQDLSNPDERAERLYDTLKNAAQPQLLVGSSMGGYVSLLNHHHPQVKGIFLLAPALYMPDYACQEYSANCPVTLVHGWQDEVIPYTHSIQFAQQTKSTLHLIDGDHRLNESLSQVGGLFSVFLDQCLP